MTNNKTSYQYQDKQRNQKQNIQKDVKEQKKQALSGLMSVHDLLKESQSMRQTSHQPGLVDKE